MRVFRWLAAAVLLGLILAACSNAAINRPALHKASAPLKVSAPLKGLSSTCGADVTATLNTFFASAPDGSSITFPANGCYTVNNTLLIQGSKNLSINGNGSMFKQAVIPSQGYQPVLNLYQDTNLSITNLTLDGAYTNDNEGPEGHYGIVLEANNGVTMTNDVIENIGGDWVYVAPPNDVSTAAVNTNVTFNGDTFLNAGYHGFTVESAGCWTTAACNGLTIENSTMTNIQVDAMDFEVDLASTDFNNGVPVDYAQDYVTVTNNTWTNWNGSNWFTSDQGQVNMTSGCPSGLGCGVDQQHDTFSNNTLNDNAPFMEVVGSELSASGGLNRYLTVTGNKYGPGFTVKPYRGGTSVAVSLENEEFLTFNNNNMPWCPGANPPACNGSPPAEYEMYVVAAIGSVQNNNFFGAIAPHDPTSNLYYVKFCGNTYGPSGSLKDGTC